MNKEKYKQVMNKIKMPEDCEEKILKKIYESPSKTESHNIKWKRVISVGIAATLCTGIIGMATVSAIQGTNWIHELFPNVNEESSIMEYAEKYSENVYDFSADVDGFDVELLGAFADESNLYYALHFTPKEENHEKYNDSFQMNCIGERWIDDTSINEKGIRMTAGSSSKPEGNGSCIYTERINFDEYTWESGTVYKAEVSASQIIEDEHIDYGVIGTISIKIDLQKEVPERSCNVSGKWENEKNFWNIKQIQIDPLNLRILGEQLNTIEDVPNQINILLKDGSTIQCQKFSLGNEDKVIKDDNVIKKEDLVNFNALFTIESPVNPYEVKAIQLDDTTIYLDKQNENINKENFISNISDFSVSGLDEFIVTPVGAMSDGNNIDFILNVKLKDNVNKLESQEYLSVDPDFTNLKVNGVSLFPSAYAGSNLQEDGSNSIIGKIELDTPIKQANIQFDITSNYKGNQYGESGTVSFKINDINQIKPKVYSAEGNWSYITSVDHIRKSFKVEEVKCTVFNILIKGTSDDIIKTPSNVYVICKDGTKIAADTKTTMTSHGISNSDNYKSELYYNLTSPVNPEEIEVIQLDDFIISLNP